MANHQSNFLLFLFAIFLFNLTRTTQTLAKQNPNSLVFGLTHSKHVLPMPKKPKLLSPTNTNSLDIVMMEPLREVRDGYLVSLSIGTPPQVMQAYMDTGSDLTWFPCGNLSFDCIDCDDFKNYKITNSDFSPYHSSTSLRDTCGSHLCLDVHSSDNNLDTCTIAGCSLATLLKGTCMRPCPSFAYTYGEGGVVVGALTRDTLRVHGRITSDNPKDVPRFCFGCVGSTYREPIGIVGFGRGVLSLPSQLGFIQKGFSHCFLPFKYANNPNISSPLIIGDLAISNNNTQSTPMLKSPMYPNFYYIGLEAITIGNSTKITNIPLNLREIDSQGNGGLLIDSGTTYTHLPGPFYSQLVTIFQSLINYPRSPDVESKSGFNLCYNVPCPTNSLVNHTDLLPPVTFHFLENVSLILSPESNFYAMSAPSNSTVVKCLLYQSMEDGGGYGPAGIFGSFQQQNVEVVYDLGKERIGFQSMDCASTSATQGFIYN